MAIKFQHNFAPTKGWQNFWDFADLKCSFSQQLPPQEYFATKQQWKLLSDALELFQFFYWLVIGGCILDSSYYLEQDLTPTYFFSCLADVIKICTKPCNMELVAKLMPIKHGKTSLHTKLYLHKEQVWSHWLSYLIVEDICTFFIGLQLRSL